MQTPPEVKNWYLIDSYNTIINNYKGEKLADNYRFGCIISQELIDILLSRQSSEQIYLGSNLSIGDKKNGEVIETTYELLFYTYYYDPETKNYLVGRANYELINYSVEYQIYLNSKTYIPLDITIDNINLNVIISTQAIRQGKIIGSTRVNYDSEKELFFSLTDIYTDRIRKRYGVSHTKNINFYYRTPVYIYNYLSRTPSTCVFACELVKKLSPTNLGLKLIADTNLPMN